MPRAIKTEADNERALRRVKALIVGGDDRSPAETELLDLLAILIERFEDERYSIASASPADVLRELMSANGMRQADIVPLFPSKGIASEVLAGRRATAKRRRVNWASSFTFRLRFS